jgi:hypothetical protein
MFSTKLKHILKQEMWLEINVIKHMLTNEIENIIQAKEMCLLMK